MRDISFEEVKMGETVKYNGYFIYCFEHAVLVMETEDATTEVAEVASVGEAIAYIDEIHRKERVRKYLER